MRKMKGKRLLSLLLTLCMVLSLVPAAAFAAKVDNVADAVVGDTITNNSATAPDGFTDEFGTSSWVQKDKRCVRK